MAAHFPHFRSKRCKQTFNVELSYSSVKTCSKSQKAKLLHLNVITSFPFSSKYKVENILKGSLGSNPSTSPSVKIQILGGKVCLRCKGKTLLVVVNKLLKTKSLLTSPSNVLPDYLLKYFLLYLTQPFMTTVHHFSSRLQVPCMMWRHNDELQLTSLTKLTTPSGKEWQSYM